MGWGQLCFLGERSGVGLHNMLCCVKWTLCRLDVCILVFTLFPPYIPRYPKNPDGGRVQQGAHMSAFTQVLPRGLNITIALSLSTIFAHARN